MNEGQNKINIQNENNNKWLKDISIAIPTVYMYINQIGLETPEI